MLNYIAQEMWITRPRQAVLMDLLKTGDFTSVKI